MDKLKFQLRIEALNNLYKAQQLEKKYSHLESTFDHHDDWVNFINSKNI